jgi:hypothetical protein
MANFHELYVLTTLHRMMDRDEKASLSEVAIQWTSPK